MPTYIVTNPETGQQLKLIGDTPPTDTDLDGIFAQQEAGTQASSQSANNPDVPGIQGEPIISDAAPTDRSAGDIAKGLGETALTLGTGATTGALGFGVGTLTGALGELTGRLKPGEGLEEAQAFAAKMTNLPESEAGQDFVKTIGETLGTLPPVGLTGGVTPKISLPKSQLPKIKLPKSRNKTLNALGEAAPEQVLKSFKKKLGEDHFTPRIFNMVKEARKQGFDDSVTTMIANSTPNTKRGMLKQILLVERTKGDARAKALEGVADLAGDSLLRNVDFVKGNNKQAGIQLGRVASKFKDDKVNMIEPVNSFFKSLDEKLGVTFNENRKPIFKGSDIETFPESRKLVNDLTLKINQSKSPTALDAHKFKRLIDKSVKYGKSDGKLDNDLENIAKSLRGDINDTLSFKYPEYKQANKQFSDSITVLDDLQDVAGQKLDFKGPNADKAAGVLIRSQLNNTGRRANLLTAIGELEGVAKKYGGDFGDDVLTLSIMADELESVFGSRTRTAIRNEARKGGVDAAIDVSQMTIPGALAVGAKKLNKARQGINEKNQLKAIKALLKEKTPQPK